MVLSAWYRRAAINPDDWVVISASHTGDTLGPEHISITIPDSP
jgi:hypothetical protein